MNRACAPSPRRSIAPKFPTLSADRRWTCPGDLWIWYPFFPYFPVFDTINAIRALRAGWWKYTLFTRFYLRGWCTGPNETYPPPPPRAPGVSCYILYSINSTLSTVWPSQTWYKVRMCLRGYVGVCICHCVCFFVCCFVRFSARKM